MKTTVDRPKIDDIDAKILRIMQKRGRITNARLAAEVGLSAPPMLERVKKLERLGVIEGYRAIVDATRVGRDFFVFAALTVDVKALADVSRVEADLAAMDEVMECHHIAGDIDFLLKINLPSQEAYKRFVVKALATIEGISRIHSWVVLSTVKASTEILIEEQEKQER